VLDGDGVITHKFFEPNLAMRVGSARLLRAALDEPLGFRSPSADGEAADTEVSGFLADPQRTLLGEVTAEVWLDADELAPGITHDLVVTFRVPDGLHLYADPAPAGSVAAGVELNNPSSNLIAGPVATPPTTPLVVAGTGEVLNVYDGDVTLAIPLTFNGTGTVRDEGGRFVEISGTVRWQACDDQACGLPATQPFRLLVAAGINPVPDIGSRGGGPGTKPMNGTAHFKRMIARRT